MPHRLLALLALFALTTLAGPARGQDAAESGKATFDFPHEWFYNGADQAMWEKMNAVVGKSVDVLEFKVRDWSGVNPQHGVLTPDVLRGRVVVLEFWSTNNEISNNAIPYLNHLFQAYPTEGVEVIAVADERGSERMDELIESKNIRYVTGRDTFRATGKAYGLMWHPWTVIIDRNGIIRAAGIRPEHIKEAVGMIVEAQPAGRELEPKTKRVNLEALAEGEGEDGEAAVGLATIPDDWIEAGFSRLENLREIVGKRPPTLETEDWRNSHALRLSERRGEVILLFFFVVGDASCSKLAVALNDYYKTKEDQGFTVIGIADAVAPDVLTDYIREFKLEFRICVDPFRTTMTKYQVDTYPDFYFIDRRGILRAADVKAPKITETTELLLKESP